MRFSVDLGPDAVAGAPTTVAISLDGTRIVYPVRASKNQQLLATRARLLDRRQGNACQYRDWRRASRKNAGRTQTDIHPITCPYARSRILAGDAQPTGLLRENFVPDTDRRPESSASAAVPMNRSFVA